MKRITLLLITLAALAGVIIFTPAPTGHAHQEPAQVVVTEIPPGYRNWKLISVAGVHPLRTFIPGIKQASITGELIIIGGQDESSTNK